MLAYGPGVALAQTIVQPFVVSVVETLLLHRPFQVPVDLRHEHEVRRLLSYALRRFRPEQLRFDTPSSLKYLWYNQHRHVAAHAVTLVGDFQQLADHRLLRRRIAVVELQRVGPAVEVRVATIGEYQRAALALHPAVVLWRASQIRFRAMDKIIRMLIHPWMIRRHVIGDEVEQQLDSSLLQPLSYLCKCPRTTEIFMHDVIA